jgi:hypothetical protein
MWLQVIMVCDVSFLGSWTSDFEAEFVVETFPACLRAVVVYTDMEPAPEVLFLFGVLMRFSTDDWD